MSAQRTTSQRLCKAKTLENSNVYITDNFDFSDENDYSPEDSNIIKGSRKITKRSKNDSPDSCENKTRAVRKLWKQHEDEQLLDLVNQYGQKWTVIGKMIGGRTGKQVRDRYLNNLRPDINNTPFSQIEDDTIISLFFKLGSKWSQIAACMGGRTEAQVKNRFYVSLKDNIPESQGNPFAFSKSNSACSNSTVDTERGENEIQVNLFDFNTLDLKRDEFSFVSYEQNAVQPVLFNTAPQQIIPNECTEEEEIEELNCQLNLARGCSYLENHYGSVHNMIFGEN
jgi:hypothetical protein